MEILKTNPKLEANVKILNQELSKHPNFKEGMEFKVTITSEGIEYLPCVATEVEDKPSCLEIMQQVYKDSLHLI